MPRIEIGKKDSAILQAKAVAYRDAYIPEALGKIIKVKFHPKTGHVHIVGVSKRSVQVSGNQNSRKGRTPRNASK